MPDVERGSVCGVGHLTVSGGDGIGALTVGCRRAGGNLKDWPEIGLLAVLRLVRDLQQNIRMARFIQAAPAGQVLAAQLAADFR